MYNYISSTWSAVIDTHIIVCFMPLCVQFCGDKKKYFALIIFSGAHAGRKCRIGIVNLFQCYRLYYIYLWLGSMMPYPNNYIIAAYYNSVTAKLVTVTKTEGLHTVPRPRRKRVNTKCALNRDVDLKQCTSKVYLRHQAPAKGARIKTVIYKRALRLMRKYC